MEVKEINPTDSYQELIKKNFAIIDVRTNAEFVFVGKVDLGKISGKSTLIPWRMFPEMNINNNFQIELEDYLNKEFKNENILDINLIFMCRSGVRSFEAATYVASLGFKNCYNMTSGFEGNINSNGHRSTVDGWKAENLPWTQ